MKIWLSKNSEIPVREQLITQIALGIASKDLKTGERLPSTSEIAADSGFMQILSAWRIKNLPNRV
jgi:DNA-binding transcriptional regulator YhcF (GntR family)